MTRNKPPAFQFYADDFLAGTIGMTDAEKGVYVTMLCLQWSKGGLTERELRAAGDADSVQYVLREKFQQSKDGKWRNSRLESVRQITEQRSKAGSKGGSKTQANGQAKVEANGQANEAAKLNPPTPTPTPTPTPVSNDFLSMSAEGFEEDWNRWIDFRYSQDGKVNEIQQAEVLRKLVGRNDPESVIADISFSIEKGAKNILDHRNDLSRSNSQRKRSKLKL